MRVIEVTILDVFRGWWFKSSIIMVRVEEWKASKLDNSSGESSTSRAESFKTFCLLKYGQ